MPIQRAKTTKTKQIVNLEAGAITATQLNSQAQSSSNRNLIINGDMSVSQRGSSWTTASGYGDYTTDRWMTGHTVTGKFSSALVEDAPTGFKYSWKATSASAYTVGASEEFIVRQKIEGTNCVHLALGTASAKTVTLSFWVKSSLTGTFTGAFLNSAENRCYIFTYAISSAATWEKKEVTVVLDTTGTWLTTTGIGLTLYFSLGAGANLVGTAGSWAGAKDLTVSGAVNFVGTNAATWQITGVQLEVGSVATDFENESYEATFNKCSRYYHRMTWDNDNNRAFPSYCSSTTQAIATHTFPVPMRTRPTAIETNGVAADYDVARINTITVCSAVPSYNEANRFRTSIVYTTAGSLTAGEGGQCRLRNDADTYLAWSAEL